SHSGCTGAGVRYIVDHSGGRLLFVDAELAGTLGGGRLGRVEQVVTIDDPEFAPRTPRVFDGPEYEQFVAVEPDDGLGCRVHDEEETYSINYTSGTTGRPKGVIYTHRGRYLHALREF